MLNNFIATWTNMYKVERLIWEEIDCISQIERSTDLIILYSSIF
jgi:hypothetical protein